MDDSSSNPYIPQESEQIRQQVYEHQSPLGRVVKWSLVITVVVAILVGIGLFFVIPKTEAVDQSARETLANELQPPAQTLKRVAFSSEMGFTLNYDNNVYASYAEVGDSTSGTDGSSAIIAGQTYENNDLRTPRAYNYVRIRPIESVESARALTTLPPELEIFATVTDKDLTAAAANAENKGLSKLSLFVKLDTDKRLAKKVADDNTIVAITVSNPVSAKVGDVSYQKVRFTTKNENHRIANTKYDECYYTIQNDQPYSACISGVRPTSVSAASLVERIFASLAFQQPKASDAEEADITEQKTSYVLPTIRLAQATKSTDDVVPVETDDEAEEEPGESALLTVTPTYYKDEASLKSIAKNQPSVVRIGTLYCADLSLKYQSGEVATTLTDACAGNVATGTFISSDGYIATTGHGIRNQKKAAINGYINFGTDQGMMLDRLQRVLDYLLKSGLILQTDADYIKEGAKIGDQEALAKVENITSVIPEDFITPVKEEYTYAIQPGDKAIVVNRTDSNKPSFAYSDSIIKAKYVASSYDTKKSIQLDFGDKPSKGDVGILKADGSFQEAAIAPMEDLKSNDQLTTIGYTAYTDNSLAIDKIRNLPIVTTSKVEQAYDEDGARLIQTNVPVLPGNDGAPVMNGQGEITGFAVYGSTYCPDKQCFANGIVRSSSELLRLLDESNIELAVGSEASTQWSEGVQQYFRSNYAASTSALANAGSSYAFNRWAAPLKDISSKNEGSDTDTSFMNQLQMIMIIVLGVLGFVTVILTIAFIIHRRRISSLQVGHYGAAASQPVAAPPIAQMPQQQMPVAPVSLPPVQQPQQIQQPHQYEQPVTLVQPNPYQNPAQPPQPPQYPAQPPAPQQGEDPFYK